MTIYYSIYLVIGFFIFLSIAKISYNLNLLDIPDKRKKHFKPTAYTGGTALSFIYIISIYFFNIDERDLNLILSIGFLIAIVGFIDDKYNLDVASKLILQIIPIFYLILLENLTLNQIGDYIYFDIKLNSFSIPFTLLSVMFLINTFNYFDGLDGLLSFTTISVLFNLYFLTSDNYVWSFLTIVLLPLILFLFFNFSLFKLPKLFLGDSGSLLLGFIIGFVLIYIANQKLAHPILLAWSISIFVFEFLSINFIRLRKKKNIFQSGLDHFHYVIFRKTKSIFLTNFFMIIINISFFTIGYLSYNLVNPLASLIMFISSFIIFLILRLKYFSK